MEQAEIDAINNEERNLTTAYQSSFNDLDEGIRKDEAEIEQLVRKMTKKYDEFCFIFYLWETL